MAKVILKLYYSFSNFIKCAFHLSKMFFSLFFIVSSVQRSQDLEGFRKFHNNFKVSVIVIFLYI